MSAKMTLGMSIAQEEQNFIDDIVSQAMKSVSKKIFNVLSGDDWVGTKV
jgi:hypothetical protein